MSSVATLELVMRPATKYEALGRREGSKSQNLRIFWREYAVYGRRKMLRDFRNLKYLQKKRTYRFNQYAYQISNIRASDCSYLITEITCSRGVITISSQKIKI